MKRILALIYRKLYAYFGPQYWWPAETPFEVMIGAILTQNTSWSNVERAINNLKKERLLSAKKLNRLRPRRLAALIKSAGYYNIKSRRLKSFLEFIFKEYDASLEKMREAPYTKLRQQLLAVNGIGQETADSILLYALGKPVFVVDAYTKRIFSRHKLIDEDADYAQVQEFFMTGLPRNARLFNEYHALLVRLGKEFCLKNNPKCALCPLRDIKKDRGGEE
ncbi:MAG: endonuclease III domain-containing protein [Candidatus Omnitrophica bacterium]|nr:endonuclease III domain-containing protein [Candidatus Omnitrophota bacterium]